MKKNPFAIKKLERDQKKIFYLLYEYAVKFLYRYTSHGSVTENFVYEGFARMFKDYKHINSSDLNFVKHLLKEQLIIICIESEMQHADLNITLNSYSVPNYSLHETLPLTKLSAKHIIEIVKSLPFPLRLLYNLSVIDGYKEEQIASLLHIQPALIQKNIRVAREYLIRAFTYNLEFERKDDLMFL